MAQDYILPQLVGRSDSLYEDPTVLSRFEIATIMNRHGLHLVEYMVKPYTSGGGYTTDEDGAGMAS